MSNIKIDREFYGGYLPNHSKLAAMNFRNAGRYLSSIGIISTDHGLGLIKGSIKKQGVPYNNAPVAVFNKNTKTLLWEILTKADGSYVFRNIAIGLECFIVAFDPNNQYNAVIQDNVVPK